MTVRVVSPAPLYSRQVMCPRCCYLLEYTGIDVQRSTLPNGDGYHYYWITCPEKQCKREIEVPAWQPILTHLSPPRGT